MLLILLGCQEKVPGPEKQWLIKIHSYLKLVAGRLIGANWLLILHCFLTQKYSAPQMGNVQ
jgi:hypothetical protein